MLSSRYVKAGLALATLTAAVACSTGKPVPAHAEEPGLVAAVTHPRELGDFVTVADAYIGSWQHRQTLTQAENVLVRKCMRRKGLDWEVDPVRKVRVTLQAYDLGYLDPALTDQFGYHPPELEKDLAASVGERPVPRSLTPAQAAAYEGRPEASSRAPAPRASGGCSAEAWRALNDGAAQADDAVAVNMANQAGERALKDSRVVRVTREWSACMRAKGLRYASPYHSRDDARWAVNHVSAAELRTARADLGCRQKVNYAGVRLAVLNAYEQASVSARRPLFAAAKERLRVRLRNAATVLGRATGTPPHK